MEREKKNNAAEERKELLEAIIQYITVHGYSPSVRELCDLTGLRSTASVSHYLNTMFKMGMIETDCGIGSPRAIRVPGYRFVKVEDEKG